LRRTFYPGKPDGIFDSDNNRLFTFNQSSGTHCPGTVSPFADFCPVVEFYPQRFSGFNPGIFPVSFSLSPFLLAFLYLRQQRVGNHQRQVWQWLMIITVPLLIIVLIFSSRDSRINPWVSPEKATTTTSDLTSGRGEILRDARHLIQEDWQIANWQAMLFGHGLRSRKILFRSQFRSWESDYLEVFINQGTVGLLLLLGIYYFFLRRVYFILQSREAHPQLWFIKGVAISALAFWLMSFLTLQIQSISSGAIFVFLYSWMIARAPVEKN
ncbi:hypothetical protein B1H10_03680, partial [candidate division KSB1 bacterium 4484_188]